MRRCHAGGCHVSSGCGGGGVGGLSSAVAAAAGAGAGVGAGASIGGRATCGQFIMGGTPMWSCRGGSGCNSWSPLVSAGVCVPRLAAGCGAAALPLGSALSWGLRPAAVELRPLSCASAGVCVPRLAAGCGAAALAAADVVSAVWVPRVRVHNAVRSPWWVLTR